MGLPEVPPVECDQDSPIPCCHQQMHRVGYGLIARFHSVNDVMVILC